MLVSKGKESEGQGQRPGSGQRSWAEGGLAWAPVALEPGQKVPLGSSLLWGWEERRCGVSGPMRGRSWRDS